MPVTYDKIATTTLSSPATTITFNSIAASWTDLRLIYVGTPVTGASLDVYFNSDTASNYSRTTLYGDGANTGSNRNSNLGFWRTTFGMTASNPSFVALDILSYASSNYKTGLSTLSADWNGSGYAYRNVGLWRNTAAITRIDLDLGGNSFASGTTATLYGILKA